MAPLPLLKLGLLLVKQVTWSITQLELMLLLLLPQLLKPDPASAPAPDTTSAQVSKPIAQYIAQRRIFKTYVCVWA